jgi:heterodisulfide reductase subunit C2
MRVALQEVLSPSDRLGDLIQQERGITVSACYQCTKCSSGCPMTFAMDFNPHEVIRLAILGQDELILGCDTIWVCSACETCTTRCPNDIDIAGVMDFFKERVVQTNHSVAQKKVLAFHQAFIDNIRLAGGRINEFLLLNLYMLKSGEGLAKVKANTIMDDVKMGIKMFQKGRLKFWPPARIQAKEELKDIYNKAKL